MQTFASESGQQEQEDVVRSGKDEVEAGAHCGWKSSHDSHFIGTRFPVTVAKERQAD